MHAMLTVECGAALLRLPRDRRMFGAAYSRAKESTCDRHGRACCESPETAARALLALAPGAQRWRMVDLPAFEAQAALSRGFWMSFHELTGGYPWLTKRVARVLHPATPMPGATAWPTSSRCSRLTPDAAAARPA